VPLHQQRRIVEGEGVPSRGQTRQQLGLVRQPMNIVQNTKMAILPRVYQHRAKRRRPAADDAAPYFVAPTNKKVPFGGALAQIAQSSSELESFVQVDWAKSIRYAPAISTGSIGRSKSDEFRREDTGVGGRRVAGDWLLNCRSAFSSWRSSRCRSRCSPRSACTTTPR